MNPEDAEQARQQQASTGGGGEREGETAGLSKTAKRNMKRKQQRKQQQQQQLQGQDGDVSAEEGAETLSAAVGKMEIGGKLSDHKGAPQHDGPSPQAQGVAAAEKTKKIKGLRKKLRQVEDLQQKLDSGEIKQPTKEQLEKLARAQALREELEELEKDS